MKKILIATVLLISITLSGCLFHVNKSKTFHPATTDKQGILIDSILKGGRWEEMYWPVVGDSIIVVDSNFFKKYKLQFK